MAMLKGWLDDSRSSRIWAVGGYIGDTHHWDYFEPHWADALNAADVPYFHMKEMASPKSPFAKWFPHNNHRGAVDAFMASLTKVIADSHVHGIISTVREDDLARFNVEKKLRLEAYPLAVYGCMLLAVRHVHNAPIELIFDRVEKVYSKLQTAEGYAETDLNWGVACRSIVLTPLAKGMGAKQVPSMQAADFVAWEFRKHQNLIDGWHQEGDIPTDIDEAWASLEKWILERHPSHEAMVRKSAGALIAPHRYANLVWDYRTLNEVHELRAGVW